MSFFKSSKKAEDVKQGGSNHITSSGVYPVTLLAPIVSVSKGGSTSIDMFVDHAGQKQVIYGNLRITNKDGSPNKIGAKIFNQLMIIADVEEVSDPIEIDLPIGKKAAIKTVAALEDLADIDVMMRVQMEYGIYQGNITEKKVIKAFFRAGDNASAEEIVNDEEAGSAFERESKYLDNITFKDEVTPEQVKQWISDKRPKGTAGDSAGGADTSEKKPSFGKKRAFGKKKES
jgi:hypothetical protein